MLKLVSTAMFFFLVNNAFAILPSAIQPNEFALLPAYCKAKLSPDPSDDKAYIGTIGLDWRHIHHYCFALNFTNRFYQATDRQDKRHYLQEAIGNYDYVLTHATPDFWMRPEILTAKAKLLEATKRHAEAIGELKKALQINSSYVSAYVVLSDVYRDLKQKSDSISVVEQGLGHTPDSRPLRRRYKLLTGKDFVTPPVTPGVDEGRKKNSSPLDVENPDLAKGTDIDGGESESKQADPASPVSEGPGEIGSPNNPYCRFCP